MKKYTKSYVLMEYELSTQTEEVEERDPSKIEDDGFMHCFRFFDISYIEDNGLLYKTKKYNYSNRVYFGTRYNLKDFIETYSSIIPNLVKSYVKNNCDNICLIRNSGLTCVPLNDGDLVYSEVCELARQKK